MISWSFSGVCDLFSSAGFVPLHDLPEHFVDSQPRSDVLELLPEAGPAPALLESGGP